MNFILLIIMFLCVNADKPRLWIRIPKHYVNDRVRYFLNKNRITDCFSFQETSTNLLLKCKIDEQLTDVSIQILPIKKKLRYYGVSVSI
jgi:hypothetical protein